MSGEDKTVDWGTYVQATHSRRVARYLAYAEAHSETSEANFDALEDERPNVLAATDRAYQAEQWEQVCRFAWALGPMDGPGFLMARGYWDELHSRLEQAVHAAEVEVTMTGTCPTARRCC